MNLLVQLTFFGIGKQIYPLNSELLIVPMALAIPPIAFPIPPMAEPTPMPMHPLGTAQLILVADDPGPKFWLKKPPI